MPQQLDDMAHCYTITLSDLLEHHTSLKSRKNTKRPAVPWFNDELRRKAERKWRQTNKDSDLRYFKAQRGNYMRPGPFCSRLHETRMKHFVHYMRQVQTHQQEILVAKLGIPSGKCQRGEFDNLLWDVPNGPS